MRGSPRWSADDPALEADPSLASARRILEAYLPTDALQARNRAFLLHFLDEHPRDAHLRSCAPGHLTASALVVDFSRQAALLTHHRKLDRWLQLGGHCDGDSNLPAVALREAREESGIEGLTVDPRLLDLDVHTIPARGDEPEHLHLDARFVVIAPDGASEIVSDESHALAWVSPSDARRWALDDSVRRLFLRVFAR